MRSSLNLIDSIETELLKQNIFENCIEIAKYSYDEILSDELLKDLPIVGSFIKAGKMALSIPDKLLMIKLLYFMDGLKKNNIPHHKRLTFYEEINDSSKNVQRIGFDLLNIIERADEIIKVKIIAEAFSWCLIGKISYRTFLRLSHGINLSFSYDLIGLLEDNSDVFRENLIISGFVNIRTGNTWGDIGQNYFELNEWGELIVQILKTLKFI